METSIKEITDNIVHNNSNDENKWSQLKLKCNQG